MKKKAGAGDRSAAFLLLLFTIIAIAWANSPWGATYDAFWDAEVQLSVGDLEAHLTLHQIVNDGLMAFFFFLVGLELPEVVARVAQERAGTLLITVAVVLVCIIVARMVPLVADLLARAKPKGG